MTISTETQALARTLVTTETHGRRALLDLNAAVAGTAREPRKDDSDDEIKKMLLSASTLTDKLLTWTASPTVQEDHLASHIDMMCHLGAFNCGVEALLKASKTDDICAQIHGVRTAMEAICGAHVALLAWCRFHGIDVPDIPTTRDGGR